MVCRNFQATMGSYNSFQPMMLIQLTVYPYNGLLLWFGVSFPRCSWHAVVDPALRCNGMATQVGSQAEPSEPHRAFHWHGVLAKPIPLTHWIPSVFLLRIVIVRVVILWYYRVDGKQPDRWFISSLSFFIYFKWSGFLKLSPVMLSVRDDLL